MADYWIKLYHEIIDDPKMATLPDRLWRRAIELFLLAGRLCPDKSGKLPDTIQLAWLLRVQAEDLQMDLAQLETTGILSKTVGGWLVVNFQKRQAAVPPAERKREERKRRHNQQYTGVTNQSRNVTQSTESESETESESYNDNNSQSGDPLSIAFVNASKIPELTGGAPSWCDALQKLHTAGVEPGDIETAVRELRNRNYSITSLRSIVTPAINVMSKRKSKVAQNSSQQPTLEPIRVPAGWKP